MNRFWKWTLGILGILIVLAILAIPFALHHRFGFSAEGGFDNRHGPMLRDHHGFGFHRFHSPMTNGRGFGHFFLLGGFVKLIFFSALLYGAYWLGKRNARVVLDPVTSPPPPAVEPEKPPEPGRKDT